MCIKNLIRALTIWANSPVLEIYHKETIRDTLKRYMFKEIQHSLLTVAKNLES